MPADVASPAPEISSLPASNAPSEPATIGRTTRRRPSPPTSSKTPADLVQAASPADDSSAAGKTGTESTKPDEAPIAGESTSALKAFQELQEWHLVKMRPFNPGKAADEYLSAEDCRSGHTAVSLWLQQFDGWLREPRIPDDIPERILHAFKTVRDRALRSQGRLSIDFVQRPSTLADHE